MPRQISRMIAAMEFVRLQPREVLIRAGDTQNDYMYVVQSGRMQLMSPSGDGMYLLQGDSFGTEALTVSGLAAEYTAVAQGNTDLWRLHRRAIRWRCPTLRCALSLRTRRSGSGRC